MPVGHPEQVHVCPCLMSDPHGFAWFMASGRLREELPPARIDVTTSMSVISAQILLYMKNSKDE